MTLALAAHAKLNLELRVSGRRPDGFHQIETRMQAISLHDLLIAAPAASTSLDVDKGAPSDQSNLVLKAAQALEAETGRSLPAAFRLIKRIPPGAGLGGGSSDAAASLRALQRLHRVEREQVERAAPKVGSDVPFFLAGGTALATGRGEALRELRTEESWFAVAWPGWEIPTAKVYAAWRGGEAATNELQTAACEVEPRLAGFAERLGADWRMTGSGSAFFRPCSTAAEATAAVAGLECWTAVTRAVGRWT